MLIPRSLNRVQSATDRGQRQYNTQITSRPAVMLADQLMTLLRAS